ncbi:MAG: Flp family type IVb pilin [Rhizobiales bacterium]|nr:Flp family type IVb pilin [Hyphomicrobiales bacterium]NRB15693.1 Flp family type IVb pilin [Hyphomicrobiales bacterium]
MIAKLKYFYADITGATAVEYSLIAAGIGLAIFGILSAIGVDIAGVLTSVDNSINK